MDTCEKLAAEFPHVIFFFFSGYKYNNSNFTIFFVRIYPARYLSGLAAGLKTKTGKIGYVAAMGKGNSEVTGGINAFALGVEKINPKARIHVRITHSWFDPTGEMFAAKALIRSGCDVIAQHCDTPKPPVEAEKAGVWSIGYSTDMNHEAPKAVITSVIWNWGAYYASVVKSVIDGSFTPKIYFGSITDGMVGLSPLSANAAPGTAQIIDKELERMKSGTFDVFEGVMITNDGRRIGEDGKRLDDSVIRDGINWYYRTIVEK
jgi:basic membrane protein A